MKLVKITTVAGREILVNTNTLISISVDLMNPAHTTILFSQGIYYTVPLNVSSVVELFKGK